MSLAETSGGSQNGGKRGFELVSQRVQDRAPEDLRLGRGGSVAGVLKRASPFQHVGGQCGEWSNGQFTTLESLEPYRPDILPGCAQTSHGHAGRDIILVLSQLTRGSSLLRQAARVPCVVEFSTKGIEQTDRLQIKHLTKLFCRPFQKITIRIEREQLFRQLVEQIDLAALIVRDCCLFSNLRGESRDHQPRDEVGDQRQNVQRAGDFKGENRRSEKEVQTTYGQRRHEGRGSEIAAQGLQDDYHQIEEASNR